MTREVKTDKEYVKGCVDYLKGLAKLGTVGEKEVAPIVRDGVTVYQVENLKDTYKVLASYYISHFSVTRDEVLEDCFDSGLVEDDEDVEASESVKIALINTLEESNIRIEEKKVTPLSKDCSELSAESVIRLYNFGVPLSSMSECFKVTPNKLEEGLQGWELGGTWLINATNMDKLKGKVLKTNCCVAARELFLTQKECKLLKSQVCSPLSKEEALQYMIDVFGYKSNKLNSKELKEKYPDLNVTAHKDFRRGLGCLQVSKDPKHYAFDDCKTPSYKHYLNAFKLLTLGMTMEDVLIITKTVPHRGLIMKMWDRYEGNLIGLLHDLDSKCNKTDFRESVFYVFENFWACIFNEVPDVRQKKWYAVKNGCLNFDKINALYYKDLKKYSYGLLLMEFMKLNDTRENRMLVANLVAALRQKYYAKGTSTLRNNLGKYSSLVYAFEEFNSTDSFIVTVGNPCWAYIKVAPGKIYSLTAEEAEKEIKRATKEDDKKQQKQDEILNRIMTEYLGVTNVKKFYDITETKKKTVRASKEEVAEEVLALQEVAEEVLALQEVAVTAESDTSDLATKEESELTLEDYVIAGEGMTNEEKVLYFLNDYSDTQIAGMVGVPEPFVKIIRNRRKEG